MIFVFAYIKKKQTATRKYDISSKLNFSVNDAGLPELAQISVPVQCATPSAGSRTYASSPIVGEDVLKNVRTRLLESKQEQWSYDHLKTFAQQLGITTMTVWCIHDAALKKLKKMLF
ncbi:MAG: hypothetical protein KBS70_05905 [Bacteroidales bacterium]|nr:hypothetical protein [Candidatus Colicola equi]